MKFRVCTLTFSIICFCFFLAYPISSLESITVGATYRMNLSTGDVLEGIVDSKTDTSVILDCKGSAYTFTALLIADYTLLAPPITKNKTESTDSIVEQVTFDTLKQRQALGTLLEITIQSGASFRGKLLSIDDENLKLDIEGSILPISQRVIILINIIQPLKHKAVDSIAAVAKPQEIFDTILVKNTETDDFGKPKADIMVVGKISQEDRNGVTITLLNNQSASFVYNQIARIFRHTIENKEEDRIKKYALPLFCPPDMVLVDIPPGKSNRPFLKVCIDKYEYPNKKEAKPETNISFKTAQDYCSKLDKRLCTSDEWQWACSGLEGYGYPYGPVFTKDYCNTDGGRNIEPSGNRYRCMSKFGAIDMAGNVFEWVKNKNGSPASMGGPLSKCQTIAGGLDGDAKPTTGLRCCKGN